MKTIVMKMSTRATIHRFVHAHGVLVGTLHTTASGIHMGSAFGLGYKFRATVAEGHVLHGRILSARTMKEITRKIEAVLEGRTL